MKPTNRKCPQSQRGGVGAEAGQAEGLLEEAQLPAGPEGQAQLEELVEPPNPGSGPRPSLPGPSWGPPARPTQVWAEGAELPAGPGHDSQPPRRTQAGKATATTRPHLRAVFLTPTLPHQQTEPPLEFTKTNAPKSAVPRQDRAARAGGLQPGLLRVM